MDTNRVWIEETSPAASQEPVVAFALHDGHNIRAEVAELMALSEPERLREEDPFTARWTTVAPTRVIGFASRFQVDLNRPREKAVYRTPDDAWGLHVWKSPLPEDVYRRSLKEYDQFYAAMKKLLDGLVDRYGRFVIYDIHSYCHRRNGPKAPPADPATNPQVNIGTGTLDRSVFGPMVDRFMTELRAYPFPGGQLDVRENIKFRGGHFSGWVHATFPGSVGVIAMEFKKFFMDEWTGVPDDDTIEEIGRALRSTVPGVVDELRRT